VSGPQPEIEAAFQKTYDRLWDEIAAFVDQRTKQ
jgi:hypothetical protein